MKIKNASAISPQANSSKDRGHQRSDKRLEFLDCIRAIAALSVLAEHGGYRFLRHFAAFTHGLFSFGKFGVTCFFLVSGFVIPFSLENRPGLKRFWILRFFRLYPIYWFSLLAALVLYSCGLKEALMPEFTAHPAGYAIANLTMLQGIMRIPHAIGLYYTLTIEMVFYIVCTILVWKNWLKRTYAICWAILIAAMVVSIGIPLILHRRVEMAGLFYVVTLAAGAALYRFHTGEVSRRAFALLMVFVGLFIWGGVWQNYSANKKNDLFEHYTFMAVALPWVAAYILFIAMLARPYIKCPRALLWVGSISYSLYLLHPLVLAFFGVQEGNLTGFGIFIIASLLISSCTYLFIEKPAMRLGRWMELRRSKGELSLIAN
jgi:peptidoglycan/LPS O-acetylase OafA/YrhL